MSVLPPMAYGAESDAVRRISMVSGYGSRASVIDGNAAIAAAAASDGGRPRISRCLNQPHVTLVEHKGIRFLITDQPSDASMGNFIQECALHNVRCLVRVCEPQYDKTRLGASGVKVVDLEYEDGQSPPDEVVEQWFSILTSVHQNDETACVAVHCKAGLGRAPALVAVALIEMGLTYDAAIELIRERRRGAFNAKQIQYLKNYRPRRRLRHLRTTQAMAGERCTIL